jgi:membrane protein required for colicin V production
MILETIQKFNWVDIVIAAVMIRALYAGFKRGFINEVLHLLAVVLTIFVVFHYTPVCVHFLEKSIFFKPQVARSVTFISLWMLVALVTRFIRGAIFLLFKIEAKTFLDKAGGIAVSAVRGLLVCSLMLWLFFSAGNEYVTRTVKSSYLSPRVVDLAPDVYRGIFNIVVAKYFPKERLKQDFLINKEKPSQPNQVQKQK